MTDDEREAQLDREFREAQERAEQLDRAPVRRRSDDSPAMPDVRRWNDDRLDDLNLRVRDMAVAVEKVAPLAERVNGLGEKLDSTEAAVSGLREDLRGIMGNPLKEARERRSALMVAVVAAVAGGGVTALVALATGGFH